MKRQARLSSQRLTADELADWRQLSQAIDAQEQTEIVNRGRVLRRQRQHATARLAAALQLLRQERERQGLSLADVQERTGIDRSALSRLENAADPNPTFATLQRYAQALGKEFVVALVDPE
jgi:ABC-type phosphate transport system auxiliary subunit